MQQLIDQITSEYEMSNEDATRIIEIVQNYQPSNAAEANAGNNEEVNDATDETEETTTAAEKTVPPVAESAAPLAVTAEAPAEEENMFEKATHFVQDHLPGGMKEKAEEMLGGLGDKVKGFFK